MEGEMEREYDFMVVKKVFWEDARDCIGQIQILYTKLPKDLIEITKKKKRPGRQWEDTEEISPVRHTSNS